MKWSLSRQNAITVFSTAADEPSWTVSLGNESADLVADSTNEPSGNLRIIKFSRREYASVTFTMSAFDVDNDATVPLSTVFSLQFSNSV